MSDNKWKITQPNSWLGMVYIDGEPAHLAFTDEEALSLHHALGKHFACNDDACGCFTAGRLSVEENARVIR